MKFQVLLFSCLLLSLDGTLGNPENTQENSEGNPDDLKQLLSDITDAKNKWNGLYEKFEKLANTECSSAENYALCDSIRNEVKSLETEDEKSSVTEKVNSMLSTIQENVDKLNRKMETGVGTSSISNRDHINAMRSLERRLQHFQMSVMNLGKEIRLPLMMLPGDSEDELADLNRNRFERSKSYDYEDINGMKHLGKTCKLLVGPYKKLLSSVDHIESMVKDINSEDRACSLKVQKVGQYKYSPVKEIKDIKDLLENISDDIKMLKKMSTREVNENEKLLKKINKKLEAELEDDDDDDKNLKKSLKNFMIEQRKQLEKTMKKMISKNKKDDDTDDDTDDDDDDDDTDMDNSDDDDDDSDNDRNKNRRKSKKYDSDDDDDDDSDGDNRRKSRRKSKKSDTDDSDDDDSESDEDNKKNRRKSKKHDTDDSDDDDDDSDDDKKKGRRKLKKNDSTDDDSEEDDDNDNSDDNSKKGKKKSKDETEDDDNDDDDDDDDDDDTNDSDYDSDKKSKKKHRESMKNHTGTVENKVKDVEMLKISQKNTASNGHNLMKQLLGIPPHTAN